MTDIIKICIVLIIILVLLRRKLGVGYVLLLASVFLMFFYTMGASSIGDTIIATVSAPITIKLLVALSFIRMFELITRENNVLQRMMESIKGTLRHKKSVIVSMPMLIGMLPSVGGAYFSAPMVDEATQGVNMTAEEKAFANYWYRHPWEYILPLYPGIILASVITKVDIRTFIILNFAYALAMIVIGNFYGLGKAKGGFSVGEPISRKGLFSFIPIILLLVLVMAFGMELHYALLIVIALLILFFQGYCTDHETRSLEGCISPYPWRYPFQGNTRAFWRGAEPQQLLNIPFDPPAASCIHSSLCSRDPDRHHSWCRWRNVSPYCINVRQ